MYIQPKNLEPALWSTGYDVAPHARLGKKVFIVRCDLDPESRFVEKGMHLKYISNTSQIHLKYISNTSEDYVKI